MIQINNQLLEEIGLGGLPEEEKKTLLRQIYETLEMRVGTKLASGMSEAQLQEFEGFTKGDIISAQTFLHANVQGWGESEQYHKLVAAYDQSRARAEEAGRQIGPRNLDVVTIEFAALKWLEVNFPTYKDVVAAELDQLKAEVQQSAPQIMAAAQQVPADIPPQQPPAAA